MLINVTTSNNIKKQYNIASNLIKVGRDPNNNIVVADKKVSRNHLLIIKDKNIYKIRDLGSRNGTYINGKKIIPGKIYPLAESDTVKIGDTTLTVLPTELKKETKNKFLIPLAIILSVLVVVTITLIIVFTVIQPGEEPESGETLVIEKTPEEPVEEYVIAEAGDDKIADVGEEITFDASQSTVSPISEETLITYLWDWDGDGTYDETSEEAVITHIYEEAGTYEVALKVTAFEDISATDTLTVTVNDVNENPIANPGGPYTATAGEELTFDGSASSDSDGEITQYIWDFGDDSTGSGVSPTHTYTEAGEYTVTLTVKDDNDGLSTEVTTTATVETVKEVLTAPTIRLEIIEGPTLAADGVCYYRVKAIVTGNPYPAISFNKDDSLGSLGKNISQVNLHKEGDSLTLEATATNSQGTASASITLADTCKRPAPSGAEIPFLIINDLGATLSLSLSGPASYSFSIPAGQQNIYVIPGTYNFTGKCQGATRSGTYDLSESGGEWRWWWQYF